MIRCKVYFTSAAREHLRFLKRWWRRSSFWEAYEKFRQDLPSDPEFDPDEIFGDIRDPSPGRDFRW